MIGDEEKKIIQDRLPSRLIEGLDECLSVYLCVGTRGPGRPPLSMGSGSLSPRRHTTDTNKDATAVLNKMALNRVRASPRVC
jgi:hypothetical protein